MKISYDAHSMIIDGKRTVIRGGAFHYYRLPSPGLWKDRLQKIKRAGYNTVDLYFWWGFHSKTAGQYDFEGVRDVDRLLALCEEVGLWVIGRPGPFINSEVDGGGHPAWLLAQDDLHLRCMENGLYIDSPRYREYVREWYEQIVPRIARCPNLILFQIENEYATADLNPAYMRFLHDLATDLGVTAPIIHNDLFKKGCWADMVDVYGVDEYAVTKFAADWRGDASTLAGLDGLGEIKRLYCPKSPLAIYELQGGWFDPWTGPGYDEIRRRLGPENMQIVTLSPLAQGATIYSHYMFAGGTNWDHVGAPPVHTSYDFAAPVHEWGGLSERYHAAKAIAMLVAAFEDEFALSEPCQDVTSSDPALLYQARRTGDTYIAYLRNFTAEVRSATLRAGRVETAPVVVQPWSMRVVLLNLAFVGARVTTNSSILTAIHHENQHLLFFYGAGRVTWTLPRSCRLLQNELNATVQGTQVVMDYEGEGWKDVVFSSGGHRYRSIFVPTADEVWSCGEYLVVGASYVGDGVSKGGVTELAHFDMQVQTAGTRAKTVRVYSVGGLNRVEVNGQMVLASEDSITSYLRFETPAPPAVTLPALGPWRVNSAVESTQSTGWRTVHAGNSLEMDKLGIFQGFAWYRATYRGKMAGIDLAIRHNAALYLNGRFVSKLDNYQSEAEGDVPESKEVSPVHVDLALDAQSDGDNTLLVLVESLGHNKGFLENARYPRGILAVQADRALAWAVRAGISGERTVPAPGFDDSAWMEVAGLGEAAGDLLWARTSFTLDLPSHAYAPIGLQFDGVADKAHIYLNGILIGRDWSVCKHRRFYLPEGLLNATGENTLALLLWRRGGPPAAGTVELQPYTIEAKHDISLY